MNTGRDALIDSLTKEALASIARVTLANVSAFAEGKPLDNQVRPEDVLKPAPRGA